MAVETVQDFNANFKEQYLNKGLQDVRPEFTVIMSSVPFVGGTEKAGTELKWPVQLSYEHGFTAHGQQGDILDLRAATVSKQQQATVSPYAFSGRTQIAEVLLRRATGGAQSFSKSLEYKIKMLQDSTSLMMEQVHLYGQMGLGDVSSAAGNVITLTQASYADHIWLGCEAMPIEIRTSAGVLRGSANITTYDTEALTITVDSIPAGVVATDVIWRAGFYGNEGAGLEKILSSTSGSLFGIAHAGAPLWKANQYNVGGLLSFEKVAEAVSRAVSRGLSDKITLHVHPRVFATLMPDFNTLKQTGADFKSRIFTTSQEVKQLEHGVYGITFIVGSVEVVLVANPFIKIGKCFGVADGELMRCGSTSITYSSMNGDGENYLRQLDNSAAYELRCFADEALFSAQLAKHIHFYGVTLS